MGRLARFLVGLLIGGRNLGRGPFAGRARSTSLLAPALAIGLLACSAAPAPQGAAGECAGTVMVASRLFFGTGMPDGGVVSQTAWEGFVAGHMNPRFRDGFTVVETQGAWWSEAEGMPMREASKLVVRLHDGSAADETRIRELVRLYKAMFRQESVLRWDSPACVWF